MSNNKRKTLERAMAFFLCIIMVIGLLIQVLPSSILNIGNVEAATGSSENKNCQAYATKEHKESPKGHCVDIGFGLCMPLYIVKVNEEGAKTYQYWLYEVDTGYNITTTYLDKSKTSVTGDYGQYFYWPVKWQNMNGEKPVDIKDLSHLGDVNAAKNIPAMGEAAAASGWTGAGQASYNEAFLGGNDGRDWPVQGISGIDKTSFKSREQSHPLNRYVASTSESQQKSTMFVNYNNEKLAPRWVVNSAGQAMGYIAFPNDTWIGGTVTKLYAANSVVSFPGYNPMFRFERGSVNNDFMYKSDGKYGFAWTDWAGKTLTQISAEDMQKSKDLGFYTNDNPVLYLNPDKAKNDNEKQKILALFATVKAYESLYGQMPVTVSLDEPEKFPLLNTKLKQQAPNRNIGDYWKTYINTANPNSIGWAAAWCPGPLTLENVDLVPQSYVYASLTAKAAVLMRMFEISGYAGGGGYSTMVCAKQDKNGNITNYNTVHLPKFETSKDLTMWGGLDYNRETETDTESLYNARMWKPNETYEETWLKIQEEGDDKRQAELDKMSWEEFRNNFVQVNPETKKQDDGTYTGGLLEYDYPYVWVQTLSSLAGDTSSDIASTFHGNFKTTWSWYNMGNLKSGAKASYDKNIAAIKGTGAANDRTVNLFLSNKTPQEYSNVSEENKVFAMPAPINNSVAETESRHVMLGDRDIGESSLSQTEKSAILLGGRLWAFNVSVWDGKPANEFNPGPMANVPNLAIPESTEEQKAVNVNIYRTLARTPKVEDLWGAAKPDKTNPAFVAYSGMIDNGESAWYQEKGPGGLEKETALLNSNLLTQGDRYKTMKDFNDNSNLSNDSATVVYMMGDASDNKRNLVIHNATVRSEDGASYDVISERPEKNKYTCYLPDITEEQAQRGEFKNYYVDWEMQYQNLNPKKPPTKSIQTDLGMFGYYKQNIKGLNDSNGENYETSTNLKSHWDITGGLDIGKYNSPVSAKGYTQATGYDNRIVPMAELAKTAYENETGIATADYIIQIPRKYDNEDNTNLSDWETLIIHFEQKVAKKDEIDNAVTKILLHDQTHTGTIFVGDPNAEVPIHIGCTYNAEIIVSRLAGTKPETNLNNNSVVAFDGTKPITKNNSMILRGIVGTVPIGKVGEGATTGNEFVYGLYDGKKNSSGILARPNDTMSYTLSNLKPTDTGYIEIRAFFNPEDYREDNNYMIAKFGGAADYVLENIELTQDVINLPPNQSQTTDIRINFSAEIGLNYDRESDPNGQRDPTLRATTVAVLMFEKGPNDFTYSEASGRVVWLDNDVQLSPNSGPRPISGTLGYGASPQSQGSPIAFRKDYSYRFIAVINAGNSTANGNLSDSFDHRFRNKVAQTFRKETDNHNNESQHEITVKAPIRPNDIKPYCWDKKNGLCDKAHLRNSWTVTFYYTECPIAVYYTCCSGKPTVCRTCCYGSGCHSWTTDKTFTETFEVQGWFRSVDTDEQWVQASSNAAVVRAGHWFDFRAITVYNTDRANMPPPNPYGGCAWLSRSPGYSQPSAYRHVRIVMDNPTGGQRKIYDSFKSGWRQEFIPQRYTVPESTMNLTITFTVDVDEFKGYWVDREHPKIELCNCSTYTMKVQNPLPIIDGTNSIF